MFHFFEKGGRIAPVVLAAGLYAGTLAAAPDAAATALYSSMASATLTITSVTNDTTPGDLSALTVEGGVDVTGCFCGPALFIEGNATGFATASGSPEFTLPDYEPVALGAGDSLTMSLSGGGSANSVGYTDTVLEALAGVLMSNDSATDSFTITFTLSYNIMATASIGDALVEDAVGEAGILAYSFSSEDEIVDAYAEADPLFGIFTGPFVDTITFTLALDPFAFDFVEVNLFAGGFAEALPEAGTLFVMIAGLAAFAGFRRRR